MPKRIQRKRTKGWRKPEGAVSVTRPGKWGNPFTIEVAGSIKTALMLYEASISERHEEIKRELRGKDLMCFCEESDPCHADILLRIANS